MNEIKVNLSLILPGSVLLSEQECSKNSKKNKKDYYDYFSMKVIGNNGKKEVLNVAVRKSRTAKQTIKLSKETYDYMIDSGNCPEPKLKKVWGKYSINEKLKYHCSKIAETLGAIDFTFEIFKD